MIRDWNDVINIKLIEVKDDSTQNSTQTNNNNSTKVFSELTEDDLHFFQFSKNILYPFGIILTSFAISAVVYGTGFLPFLLFHEFVILLGFFLGFVSGGFLGRDWLRLFRKFYPELYNEIEEVIKSLK